MVSKNAYRLLRIAKGIKGIDLAEALHIDKSMLSRVETEVRRAPQSYRKLYSDYFGVSCEFIDMINSKEYQEKPYSDLLMIVLEELKRIESQ